MRTLLFIAYYLPPMGSSGVQRPFNLLRHLPEFGWNPVILAPETGMYHAMDFSLEAELQQLGLHIYRVKGHTPFHRSGGNPRTAPRIPENMARVLRWVSAFRFLPDNKVGWIEPALSMAEEIVRRHKPELVFATSPPPSNLMLAAKIRQRHEIPAVFDFRDDWVGNHQQVYPTAWHRNKMIQLERQTIPHSDAIITVNPVIRDALADRHPEYPHAMVSIPSGYDSGCFERPSAPSVPRDPSKMTLLYSGRFYGENQPDIFLEAVSRVVSEDENMRSRLRIVFQGGLEPRHLRLIDTLGISRLCVDAGYLPHRTAVSNLLEADTLWLTAAHKNRGEQVSTGKVFEYMASGKPILAMAPEDGALHQVLKGYGPFQMANPHNVDSVENALVALIHAHFGGTLAPVNHGHVERFTFRRMAEHVAEVLNGVVRQRKEAESND